MSKRNVAPRVDGDPEDSSAILHNPMSNSPMNPTLPNIDLQPTHSPEFYTGLGILSDEQILDLCENHGMITPFVTTQKRVSENGKKIISYGPSSYGYDFRLGNEFLIFSNSTQSDRGYVDPKDFDPNCYVRHVGDSVIIPPGGFILASTMETFSLPRDVTGVVLGKSTYARVGIQTLATPAEAGWKGTLTLEFANTTPRPVKMYAGEGAIQVLFFRGLPCKTSYADRNGKYQNQVGITLPKA